MGRIDARAGAAPARPSVRSRESREVETGVRDDDEGQAAPALPVVALASSAGGMHALFAVLGGMPETFRGAVVVVQHLAPHHRSVLAQLLARRTPLSVSEAHEGDRLQAGHVYVAPPDRHVLVNADRTLTLSNDPPVHFLRPSADRLFGSLAEACGEQAVAVVLTGTGKDGAVGARAVHQKGGTVIAQDEASSDFFGMPSAAIASGAVAQVLPLERIAPALVALVGAG